MIQTVDNYNLLNIDIKTTIKERKEYLKRHHYYCLSHKTPKEVAVSLKQYIEYKNNTFLSFFKDKEKIRLKNEDDLIISIKKYSDDKYQAQTGNYIGKFVWDGLEIDIKSRFNNKFLERMLNFINDVFLDDVSVFNAKEGDDLDYSKFIIYYMFIQKLEKAFLLGLPKSYQSIKHHEMKLKGKIDINRFIKHDIPFKGRISSTSREQKEIQEIIDVLYKAVSIIDKEVKNNNGISTKNISHIKTHLKQHKSNRYVSNETISKSIKSKALQNPIFTPYKKVLEYAKFIINANNLEEKPKGSKETFGFLVNVAELFEIYLYKLLQKEFPDWEVKHEPELEVYPKPLFYHRHMFPDIVMKKDRKVLVFDAKYKRMNFNSGIGDGKYGDLDRSDFFQIHTYMSYYQNQKDLTLIAGGLLYPIEEEFDCRFNDKKCKKDYSNKVTHSKSWLGNDKVKFIVDGIDLSKIDEGILESMSDEEKVKKQRKNIKDSEDNFIGRIKKIVIN